MNWFSNLTTAAADFFKTPAAGQLLGANPNNSTAKPATASKLPSWAPWAIGGAAVLLIVGVIFVAQRR